MPAFEHNKTIQNWIEEVFHFIKLVNCRLHLTAGADNVSHLPLKECKVHTNFTICWLSRCYLSFRDDSFITFQGLHATYCVVWGRASFMSSKKKSRVKKSSCYGAAFLWGRVKLAGWRETVGTKWLRAVATRVSPFFLYTYSGIQINHITHYQPKIDFQ